MYSQLTSSIKFAVDSCTRTTKLIRLNKKKWYTNELREIKKKMLMVRFKKDKEPEDLIKIKELKKEFKNIMKKNIFLYGKNEYFKVGKLIKCNNGDAFFKRVILVKNKEKEIIEIDINTLVRHYSEIFNRPLNVSDEVIQFVHNETNDIIHENFKSMSIDVLDLKNAIKQSNSSNVCGNDGISSRMIKNCDKKFISSILLFFFRFIFHHVLFRIILISRILSQLKKIKINQ